MYCDSLGYFEKHIFSCKNCCGCFLSNLSNKLGHSLLQHLVTLTVTVPTQSTEILNRIYQIETYQPRLEWFQIIHRLTEVSNH